MRADTGRCDTGNWRSFAGILFPNMMGAPAPDTPSAAPAPPEPQVPKRLAMRAPQEDFTSDHFLFGKLLGLGSYSKASCKVSPPRLSLYRSVGESVVVFTRWFLVEFLLPIAMHIEVALIRLLQSVGCENVMDILCVA